MMKNLFFILISILVTGTHCILTDEEEKYPHVYQIMEDEFRERILSVLSKKFTHCRIKGASFEDAVDNATTCFKEFYSPNDTMCDIVTKNYIDCVQPIAQTFDDCLAKDLESLGSHLINSTLFVVEYLCSLDIEQIQALSNQCVKEIDFMISNSKCLVRAEAKLSAQFKDGTSASFQEIICSIYPDVKPCFEIKVKTACANPNTREIVMGMLDALLYKPCRH